MKKNTLLKINVIICVIIILGFIATSWISYQANYKSFQKNIETVTELSSEGLYNDISSIFSKPVNISLTMANDSLLKEFLIEEQTDDEAWQTKMEEYLTSYKDKYNYDSVFLVSTKTANYYHYEGINRVLVKDSSENDWYYQLLDSKDEYALNIDNDEAKDNTVTVFVNCKIEDTNGNIVGVVGVGLQVNSLQELLHTYEQEYNVKTYLVNTQGTVEIASMATDYEQINLFEQEKFKERQSDILNAQHEQTSYWHNSSTEEEFIVSRYEPNLNWHLVVESDTTLANASFQQEFLRNIAIISFIVLLILIIISYVIKRYNAKIAELTVSQELEYQRLLHGTTQGLYENIFEIDITHNRAGGESTRKFYESLGMRADEAYDQALLVIAKKQIKTEYAQGYVDTFSPKAVEEAYKNGITNLNYNFMITDDNENYHWVRISAQIFFWTSDQSIRMIAYRKNVDEEKKREQALLEGIKKDSMTGLYNKRTTEDMIGSFLSEETEENKKKHAFLILDIDNFKAVNDTQGHIFGDMVIHEISAEIKNQFREDDIVGRLGGDEFVVLMKNIDHIGALEQKMARICQRLKQKQFSSEHPVSISCSIGISLFPEDGKTYSELYENADQALYYAKSHGKNSYVIFDTRKDDESIRIDQRDMESLMNMATDGLAQYACCEPMKLLYFNTKFMDLFGYHFEALSSPDYDPLSTISPDDVERVVKVIKDAAKDKKPFTTHMQIRHCNGTYIHVKLKAIFISELYKNEYPVFYVMYSKM